MRWWARKSLMRRWAWVGLMRWWLGAAQTVYNPYCVTDTCSSYLTGKQCCSDCLAEGLTVGECNRQNFHYPAYGFDGRYIGGCQPCPMNQFSHFCSCEACESCGDWGYYGQPCFGDSSGDNCKVCRAPCGPGEAELHGCGRPDYNLDRQCGQCPAGKYRDNVNTQPGCVDCTPPCSPGWRETRACGPINDRQCAKCPDDSYVSGGVTCVACTSGKYRTLDKLGCATCRTCTRFESSSGCNGAVDRTCTSCGGNKMTLALNAETCAGCENGYFNTGASSCAVCQDSSCGAGNYRTCTFTDARGGERTCTPCQGQAEAFSVKCGAGFGVDTRCDGKGSAMVSCSGCPLGTERPVQNSITNEIQKCLACQQGYYKAVVDGNPCVACTNKPASNSQYVSWGADSPRVNNCPW